jgi:hypothetical protein
MLQKKCPFDALKSNGLEAAMKTFAYNEYYDIISDKLQIILFFVDCQLK